jgi:hypothetical protein
MNIDDSYKTRGNITPELRESFVRYIEHGIPTGSFLEAVLCNDLREACCRADMQNRFVLYDIIMYLHNYAPGVCWGDRKAVAAWQGHQGLAGWPDAHREPAVET